MTLLSTDILRSGSFAISVWRAIRAMKAVELLVRKGGDKGGKWIVKRK